MDTSKEPSISGPMFPHGKTDRDAAPPSWLKGQIIGVRSGRQGEGAAQIITIKLDDWEHNPKKLLNVEVDLRFHTRS